MLFANERKHKLTLPAQLSDGSRPNISYLLGYLIDNLMKDQRKELFVLEDNVYVSCKQGGHTYIELTGALDGPESSF